MVIGVSAPSPTIVPAFVLPDQHGTPFRSTTLRGRRHLVLLVLPDTDDATREYLGTFAAHHDAWAWLHTQLLALLPAPAAFVGDMPFPVLHDEDGRVRTALAVRDSAAVIVADQDGRIMQMQHAPTAATLPDVETVLAWAWDVAKPKGG